MNELVPIDVTLEGKVTSLSCVLPNAPSAKLLKPSGKFTFLIAVLPLKAE